MTKFAPDEEMIRKLAELLEETGLSEIEYESEGKRIRLARHGSNAHWPSHAAAPAVVPSVVTPTAGGATAAAESLPAGAVTSPMVGTAYLAAEPGAPAFVKVGDNIKEGQTLLIIEAMKVMNPIPSPRSGKVTAILVQDGQPVEFGEPLIVIE